MNYPNHQIRSYCLYLGEFTDSDDKKFDLGVYECERTGDVSHAIVYGPEDSQYLSGSIEDFTSREVCKENIRRYESFVA